MCLKYYLFNYPSFLNTNQFRVIVTENNIENTTTYGLLLSEKTHTIIPENNWYNNLDVYNVVEKKNALSIILNREFVLLIVCELFCTLSH